jgi:hypothetical protein
MPPRYVWAARTAMPTGRESTYTRRSRRLALVVNLTLTAVILAVALIAGPGPEPSQTAARRPAANPTDANPTDVPGSRSSDCCCGSVRGGRTERFAQLRAPGHAELREQPVQVRADRAVGEEEALADLAVRETFRRQLRDLELLRGQLRPCLGHGTAGRFARGA